MIPYQQLKTSLVDKHEDFKLSTVHNPLSDVPATRVNVLWNGRPDLEGISIRVPRTMAKFLDMCSECWDEEEELIKVWNSDGFLINSCRSFINNETVFVGTAKETFKSRPIFSRHPTSPRSFFNHLTSRSYFDLNLKDSPSAPNPYRVSMENASALDSFWTDPDFDISNHNLSEVFSHFDADHDGFVTYDKFREGLEQFNLTRALSNEEFQVLISQFDIDQSGDISEDEFIKAIQSLMISARLTGEAPAKVGVLEECFVVDYSISGVNYRTTSVAASSLRYLQMTSLLEEPMGPAEGFKTRWINIVGNHLPTLYGLGAVYDLSNFEIQDAVSGIERSRSVLHGLPEDESSHMQIILRMVYPDDVPNLRLRDEQLTVFWLANTVITIQSTANAFLIDKLRSRLEIQSKNNISQSKLRRQGSEYLVYSIFDRLADFAYSTVQQFQKELVVLDKEVVSPERTLPGIMNRVHRVKREVSILMDCLKPFHQTVSKLRTFVDVRFKGAEENLEIIEGYKDVQDRMELMNDQVKFHFNWCISLNEQFHNQQSHRMNEVMYLLTLVTTIFIPAQFLTGVYGMNFISMPELQWEYGYVVFWIMVVILASSTFMYFKTKRWL